MVVDDSVDPEVLAHHRMKWYTFLEVAGSTNPSVLTVVMKIRNLLIAAAYWRVVAADQPFRTINWMLGSVTSAATAPGLSNVS